MTVFASYKIALSPTRIGMTIEGDSFVSFSGEKKLTKSGVEAAREAIKKSCSDRLVQLGKSPLEETENVIIHYITRLDA